jgi:glycosyltransferase involved in cell wall biosynthesis
MNNFASLCLLAYKRPQQLIDCIESLTKTCDYPYQLIVNLDMCDEVNFLYLSDLLRQEKISNLIVNTGNNRGVGRSFQSCLGVAEGKYIVKVDTDIVFYPQWLSTMVDILEKNPDVGVVSPFDYNKWDPSDDRFKPENNRIEERENCYIVKDFVSSIYAFRSSELGMIQLEGRQIPDDGTHQRFGKMALTKENLVENKAFGVFKSTYVSGTEDAPYKTPTHDKPLIFESGRI